MTSIRTPSTTPTCDRIDSPRSGTRRRAYRAGLAAVLAAAALALAPVSAPAQAPEQEPRGMTVYDVAELQSVGEVAVSPDGELLAYTVRVPRQPFVDENGPAWEELHVADLEGRSRPFVTGAVNVSSVAWTPDGSGISFRAKREGDDETALYVIPRDGGEARRVLTHETGVGAYSWSPDGSRIAYLAPEPEPEEKEELAEKGFNQEVYEENLRSDEVWIAEVGEGERESESPAERRRLDLPGSASELHWSPDGDRLALALAPTPLIDDHYMNRRVKVVDVETGQVTAQVANPGKIGEIAWSPDGSRLALISAAAPHDPLEGRLTVAPASGGEPRDLIPGLEAHVVDLAWKDAETLYFIVHQGVEARFEEVHRDGQGRRTLVEAGGPIWEEFSSSTGGSTVALVGDSPRHPDELFLFTGDGGEPRRLTDSNPWLAHRRLAEQEVVSYEARDGLELQGLLIRPLDAEEGKRYPLILKVHGGPESHYTNGWLTSYSSPGQVAAARGYAVFYPNYRGSTGRGVEFSMLSQGDPAGEEFDDLVDAVDHLVATGLVDADRTGITGGSYGGYATGWGSTYYSERFAAGVMFVGISEKIAKWGSSDIPRELKLVHDRHWPWEDWDLMLERSPVYHAEGAETPLLILHGEEDTRVHPSQSLILYRYLEVLDQAPVRLVWYPGEGHGNRKAASRLDFSLRMFRWFDHYLKGPGGEPPPPDVEYERPEEAGGEEAGESADEAADGDGEHGVDGEYGGGGEGAG